MVKLFRDITLFAVKGVQLPFETQLEDQNWKVYFICRHIDTFMISNSRVHTYVMSENVIKI